MRRVFIPLLMFSVACTWVGWQAAFAQNKSPARALPPRWNDDIKSVFPEDAAKELKGARPNFASGAPAAGTTNVATSSGSGGTPAAPAAAGSVAWSKIIEPDYVLAEIKSYQNLVADDVKSLSGFKGGGYKNSRISYSMLGLMFAIIAEYDGDIRFKKDALAARELFGRVSMNLKVSTDQAFNESKARAEDLAALIRGDTIETPPNIDPKVKWQEKVANRPPLMTRLNTATEERLNKAMSDAAAFAKSSEMVIHEAQVIAAISAAIQREGYGSADDDTYLQYARDMQNSATAISNAVKAKDYDAASKAFSAIKQKCDECHGAYR
jgi:hypothetical protein